MPNGCPGVLVCAFHTNLLLSSVHRDLRETRQRFDSAGSDLKRKDGQLRELQQRLENSEGCKCLCLIIFVFYVLQLFGRWDLYHVLILCG